MKVRKRIKIGIRTRFFIIKDDGKGLRFPVYYKDILIAHLFCNGDIRLINQDSWKKNWDFIIAFNDVGNKDLYILEDSK